MLKWLLVLSFIGNQVFEALIEYLNSAHLKSALPENVRDVYDEDEYERWISYERDYGKCYAVQATVDGILMTLLLACNVYSYVFDLLGGMNLYVQYLIMILIFTAISLVIGTPFSWYKTFVIEERYGMNKTTGRTFFLDLVKGLLLGVIISFLVMALILYLFENHGNRAIVMTMIALTVFSLLISTLSMPLMRLFNKFTPLEDGELKERILSLCDRYGVKVGKIVVRDASRRTTKSNAFCTGYKRKTIALDDNLVSSFDDDEIVAVFSHEFAHARYHHMLKSLPFNILRIWLVVGAMGLILNIPTLFTVFGFGSINYFFAQVLIGPVMWPLEVLLDAFSNSISRKHEYQADAFAAKEGYGNALICALKKLNKESLADINPHPLEVFLHYSHPTLSQRIEAILRNE